MGKLFKNCEFCQKLFQTWTSANRLYCSKDCYLNCPKRKEKALNFYKNNPIEVHQKRWKNIAKANEVHLTNEEIKKLEEYLELGYIKDKKKLMKAAKISKSYKALNNYIRDNPKWWNNFNLFKGQLSWKVQDLTPYQFRELLRDLKTKSSTYLQNKWGIGLKTDKRLRDFYNIDISYRKGYGQTYPEKVVEKLLSDLSIDYQKEITFKSGRFRVDFLLTNKTIIEVQGDYWHGNPLIYKYENYTEDQWKNWYNDWFKRDYFSLKGFNIIYIWEYDIYNNFEKVLKQLLKIKQ